MSSSTDIRATELLPPMVGMVAVGLAWAVDLSFNDLPLSPAGLLEAHGKNPVLVLVDLLPLGLLFVTWQLGERRRLREHLVRVREHHETARTRLANELKQVVTGVFDGLITTAPDGHIVRCNPTAEKQFGFQSEELAGKSIRDVLLGLDFVGEGLTEPRRTWRREVLAIEKRIQGKHKSGIRFPVAVTEAPIDIAGGRGTLYTIRDLGDQISTAETQLRMEVDPKAFEPVSDSRAVPPGDTRLRTGLQRIRAPLASLVGQTRDIRSRLEADTEIEEALHRIEGEGHTLLVRLSNTLDMDRVERGELDLHIETVPVDAVALPAVDAVRSITRGSRNWIETELPEVDATCEVDQRAARDLLVNLLLNASQNTEGGRIALRVRRESNGPLYDVLFEVEDPGRGLTAEEIHAHLHEPDPDSPALGLRVTRALADEMGGELTLRSTPGTGTTAILRVPSKDKPTVVPARSRRWAPPSKDKERKERNALIAGASPVAAALIRDALEDHRWGVVELRAAEALIAIQDSRPDLVVFGFEQPQKSWQVWLEMKRHPILGLIPAMCVDDGTQSRRAWTTRLASSPLDAEAVGVMAGHLHASRIVPRAMLVERRDFERNTLSATLRGAGWWVYAPPSVDVALELAAELPPELLVLGSELGESAQIGETLSVIRGVPATKDLPLILAPGRDLTEDEQTRADRAHATVLGPTDPPDLLVVHATLALSASDEEG